MKSNNTKTKTKTENKNRAPQPEHRDDVATFQKVPQSSDVEKAHQNRKTHQIGRNPMRSIGPNMTSTTRKTQTTQEVVNDEGNRVSLHPNQIWQRPKNKLERKFQTGWGSPVVPRANALIAPPRTRITSKLWGLDVKGIKVFWKKRKSGWKVERGESFSLPNTQFIMNYLYINFGSFVWI
jgi:hypothetical protein